jgi:hypothetical protein
MAMNQQSKDFFISYNHRDTAWAEWIAWELEEAGYSTCIQAWDFGVGSNFVIEMDKALRLASRVIAVLSPNYFDSRFTLSEWSATFGKDPTGGNRKLVPIRVQQVDLDGFLGQIVYIDFVGKDENTAKIELRDGIREGRRKPLEKPKFPTLMAVPFPGAAKEDKPEPSEPSEVPGSFHVVTLEFHARDSYIYTAQVMDERCFRRCRWILGIRSNLGESHLLRIVPRIVKVCSAEGVVRLVQLALPGLELRHLSVRPSAISPQVDMHYFSISTFGVCWEHLLKTRQIGIYIPGEIGGASFEVTVITQANE